MIKTNLERKINFLNKLKNSKKFIHDYEFLLKEMISTLSSNNKIFLCGNGGSASDCNHISAEFTGKFNHDRRPLKVESLCANISHITAVANDFGYEKIFSRLIGDYVNQNDLLICLTTSGKSKNIINALKKTNKLKIKSIVISGKDNQSLNYANYKLVLGSEITPLIQEATMLILHSLCGEIENFFLKRTINNI